MITISPVSKFCLAALLVGLGLAAQARENPGETSAQIRRTTFGVPHILASDDRGLGYGIGYAYGQDNLCLLANEVVTVNGQRSRFFGPEQRTLEQRKNLTSDLFFTWLNTPQAVSAFWQAQPAPIQALLEGYAQGFNRALAERRGQGLPAECQGGEWLRPITAFDLIKLTRRLLVEGGVGQFAEAVVGATPPNVAAQRDLKDFRVALDNQQRFALERGSNAVAVGSERSASGRGMLLANPHFPWQGGMRFYQMHLTVPGQLDVMGAALPGLPLVNIGFNRHLAWTHTVDASRHFTLHRLQLDPKDPTRYLFDGQSLPLERQRLTVTVKGADGQLREVGHELFSSRFGPVVQWPGRLDWTPQVAFSLRDANLDNTRVLQQWHAINQADSLAALQASVQRLQGIPWVNTLATDAGGQALYLNQSVVPYVDAELLGRCSDPKAGLEMIVLDGSRSECSWKVDSRAAQPGIFPAQMQPQLSRTDFVQHANDTAWLVNPAQPLSGFSPLISRDNLPLGPRARFALTRLEKPGKLGAEDLKNMVMDDQVYLADLLLPDLLKWCTGNGDDARLKEVCTALGKWDGRASLDSGLGLVHFQVIMHALQEKGGFWRVAFNPADPLHTPRGLAWERAAVAKMLREAALASAARVAGADPSLQWGQIQQAADGTPIHGGPANLGVYNAIQSVDAAPGKRKVVSGTSYLQLVTFDADGPKAEGLLVFSQSTEAASPHAGDQTRAFSAGQWQPTPFTEAQIKADPQYRSQVIREPSTVETAVSR
ncbi:acylase [Pseudomonas sp. 148P]|uniref:Acylase n=1 Tax=Pseudomonas ulcerans TaxID=3115852 RepID=A0ABU7HY54_9PSED|nr:MULTISPECIES: acylase [unclassified Pseudomonas]MEE1924815.1 acylase [Pseudomonas sp. 147P]MEE1936333.1 acylase [Pseudomonas sp. 148P]